MTENDILTPSQRRELAAYAGIDGTGLDDAGLLERVASRIGLTGELAIDPEGIVELERGDVLVALESVPEEDAHLVHRPDLLYVSVALRTRSTGERDELVKAGLLDPPDPDAPEESLTLRADDAPADEDWNFAWWGAFRTVLPTDAGVATQMEALHRVMEEASAVLERGEVGPFFERTAWLRDEDDEPEGFEDDDDEDYDDDYDDDLDDGADDGADDDDASGGAPYA
jgi:hypothetical protein